MPSRTSVFCMLMVMGLTILWLHAASPTRGATTADFGDAPDSTNASRDTMTAYEAVVAHFPTVAGPAAPFGPRHENSTTIFFLGAEISAEEHADMGLDEDPDGVNNLNPSLNLNDKDGYDDGVRLPDGFAHCVPVTLEYEVTLVSTYAGPIYANLWADWNRDGDWQDGALGSCPGGAAKEWVMQNRLLNASTPGTHTFQVTFIPYFPIASEDTWLRLSVSEQQSLSDGSAPASGFQYGETEDYYLPGVRYVANLPMVRGEPDEPPDYEPTDGLFAEPDEGESLVVAEWIQVPSGTDTTRVSKDNVALQLRNNSARPVPVTLSLVVVGGGAKDRKTFDEMRVPAQGTLLIDDALGWSRLMNSDWLSPATVLGEFSYAMPEEEEEIDSLGDVPATGEVLPIYLHHDESTPGSVVLYNEEAYRVQVQAMSFANAPKLSQSLEALLPPGGIPEGLSQIVGYAADDAIVNEEAPQDEDHDHEPLDRETAEATATVCLEWFTAPLDNNKGEDFGLNDDGWLARGANVQIFDNGSEVYDTFLDEQGCAVVAVTPGGTLYIRFKGRARLETSNQGFIHLFRMYPNLTYYEVDGFVTGVQPGGVYRPEFFGNDAFSMVSYAAQEQFNGGVSGAILVLIKDQCAANGAQTCFDADYQGWDAMFISSERWRKKFQVGHIYGHAILWQEADYGYDCSYVGSNWNMGSIEYASCAAMEGWAIFVAGDIWNSPAGSNPDGVYVTNGGAVYSLDVPYSKCYEVFGPLNCGAYGVPKDWMRQWWDFHTNSWSGTPGVPASHSSMFNLIDDVSWDSTGPMAVSIDIREELQGAQLTRWNWYTCTNGVDTLGATGFCP